MQKHPDNKVSNTHKHRDSKVNKMAGNLHNKIPSIWAIPDVRNFIFSKGRMVAIFFRIHIYVFDFAEIIKWYGMPNSLL